ALGMITSAGCTRSQTRTYTATDGCGNTATCTQVFTWTEDTTPPTFTFCPAGLNLGCNPTGIPAAGNATATDACGTPTITSALGMITSTGCTRSQTRTYTATDGCGNTATCREVFTWTEDITPPVFTVCPSGNDLGCNPNGLPAPGAATATDDCGTPGITSSTGSITSDGCLRYQTRTYTATDGCGNTATCKQEFSWTEDLTPPTFTFCPQGSNLGCNPMAGVPSAGVATATDACSTPTISSTLGMITSMGCTRSQTRTYTATDGCGNTATCTQVFTWTEDTTPPVVTCPLDVAVSCAGQVPAVNIGSLNTIDNCSGSVTNTFVGDVISNQTCANRFIVSRTYRGTDACGNSGTCIQTIKVDDQTPPALTCPMGTTVTCAAQIPAVNIAGVTGLSDNCGGTIVVTHIGDGITNQTCANRFNVVRRYRATDVCGNTASCSQIISVFDNVAPTITCPLPLVVQCANLVPAPTPVSVIASDNCVGSVTVGHVNSLISNQTCVNRFMITRIYRATDACGNSATCTQRISVYDNTKPVLTGLPPLEQTVECGTPTPVPNVKATDNCSGSTTVQFTTWTTQDPGVCSNYYNIWRKWLATDACGNTAVFTGKIRVVDTKPPVFTNVPPDVNGDCEDALLSHAPIPVDACGFAFIVSYSEKITCSPGQLFVTRTWIAGDYCNNTAVVVQHATATDTEPPRPMDVPADVTIHVGQPLPPLPNPPVWGCDLCFLVLDVSVTYQQKTFPGKVLRIWKFCDCAYNCISDTQVITIVPNLIPDNPTLPASSVEAQQGVMQWTLVPNPASDNVTLEYTSLADQPAEIILMDMTGMVVMKQEVSVVEGFNSIPLLISRLQAGAYHVLLRSGDGTGQKIFVIAR
ncbi:MAG: T9SS type A sorting domain-containing protein, partial [Saprospiraceae bacterium]